MTRYGYFLSCEEYSPTDLIRQARLAEEAGFDALWISDHFHPWLDEQGQSGFVWSMIGAISQVTSLPVTTAVTCPLLRQHPAIVAQAAATSALLTGGRFTLGVGTGEALNEHILGGRWPSAEERLDMLEEAVQVIRELLSGKLISHTGRHYTVETARLYSVPDQPPPIYMSGFGDKAIRLAARIADGYMCVQPNADFVRLYREAGGGERPVQGGLKVCWGQDAAQARKTMHRLWPTDAIPGEAAPAAAAAAALQPGRGARLRRHDLRAVRTRSGRSSRRRARLHRRRVRRGLHRPGRRRARGLLRVLRPARTPAAARSRVATLRSRSRRPVSAEVTDMPAVAQGVPWAVPESRTERMASMENRSLGRGRVSVPVVGLGTWQRLEAAAALRPAPRAHRHRHRGRNPAHRHLPWPAHLATLEAAVQPAALPGATGRRSAVQPGPLQRRGGRSRLHHAPAPDRRPRRYLCGHPILFRSVRDLGPSLPVVHVGPENRKVVRLCGSQRGSRGTEPGPICR